MVISKYTMVVTMLQLRAAKPWLKINFFHLYNPRYAQTLQYTVCGWVLWCNAALFRFYLPKRQMYSQT
jgi:hypothetical protein